MKCHFTKYWNLHYSKSQWAHKQTQNCCSYNTNSTLLTNILYVTKTTRNELLKHAIFLLLCVGVSQIFHFNFISSSKDFFRPLEAYSLLFTHTVLNIEI